MAMLQRASLSALLCLLLAALLSPSPARAARSDVFTVAGVKVDAKAENAVKAKARAVAQGETRALHTLLKRLARYTDYARLPEVDARLARRMLDNVSFVRERNSRTRYIATLNYGFRADKIRRLLRGRGVAFLDRQAPEVILVPAAGETVEAPLHRLWRQALASLDLAHALTPLRLMPAQAAPGVSLPDARQLARAHNADRLVVASAHLPAGGSHLRITLAGQDAVGRFGTVQNIRIRDGALAEAAQTGAAIVLKILEGRWKASRLGLGDDDSAAAGAQARQSNDKVLMTVRYSGLPEWIAIRRKLENISGVYDMTPGALSPRGATVTLSYPGGAGALSRAVRRAGLSLQNHGGEWVLRSR